jgi:hopanoid-associated phosphorylase
MILVAVGMRSEAALLPPGVRPIISGGDPARLRALLEAEPHPPRAVLSFGIAGGLDPELEAGDLVVATRVRASQGAWRADMAWAARLARITGARLGVLAGAEAVVAGPAGKRALRMATDAIAVDLESAAAAAYAARHGLPFAAFRAVADAAGETIPAAALVGLTPDGRTAPLRVLAALMRSPTQFRPLLDVAKRSKQGLEALAHGVSLLRGELRPVEGDTRPSPR